MATLIGQSNFNGKNGDKFQLNLYYDILNQDFVNNLSTIRYYLYFTSTGGYGGSGGTLKGYINGSEVGSANSISAHENKFLGIRDIPIKHNPNGSFPNTEFSASIDTPWTLGDASVSGILTSANVPTIPRASSVNCTDGNIESTVSININRADKSFLHTLRYAFGKLSGTIASSVAENYGWTLPKEFYSQVTNAKSGICTIYCDTYSAGTLLGTNSYIFTVRVDEEKNRPTVKATVVDTNEKSIALTGDSNILVKNVSNVQVKIDAEAKNGATIKTKKVECGGKTGTGDTIILDSIQSGIFTIYAEDSHIDLNGRGIIGYTDPNPIQKEIVDYVPLTLNVRFQRADAVSGDVKLSYNGNYFSGSFGAKENTLEVKYRYCEFGKQMPSTYTILKPVIQKNAYSQELILDPKFDYRKSYEFEIIATDEIESKKISNTPETKIGKGNPIFALFEDSVLIGGGLNLEIGEGKNSIIQINSDNKPRLNPDLICRVGDLILSTIAENPNVRFGGTWVLWGTGQVPVGIDTSQSEFNTIGKTGGSKTHTSTVDELAPHIHTATAYGLAEGGYAAKAAHLIYKDETTTSWVSNGLSWIDSAGGGKPYEILQPYITCYMWKRTT